MLSHKTQQGVTLIETIVFIVVISIALVALVRVYAQSVSNSVDPVVRIRALELGQAQLDEILARKFDESTPTGGIPACNSSVAGAPACSGLVTDTDFDDVADYDGASFGSSPYVISVTVAEAGTEIGLASDNMAKRVTIEVTMPGGDSIFLAAYKANF